MIIVILASLSVLFLGLWLMAIHRGGYSWGTVEDWTGPLCLFSVMFLIVALIALPIARMSTRSFMLKLETTRSTFAAANVNECVLESAGILSDIAEINSTLAAKQYWQKNFWVGVYENPAIQNVEPIR